MLLLAPVNCGKKNFDWIIEPVNELTKQEKYIPCDFRTTINHNNFLGFFFFCCFFMTFNYSRLDKSKNRYIRIIIIIWRALIFFANTYTKLSSLNLFPVYFCCCRGYQMMKCQCIFNEFSFEQAILISACE